MASELAEKPETWLEKCVRARLQSCRKTPKRDPGFSPCGLSSLSPQPLSHAPFHAPEQALSSSSENALFLTALGARVLGRSAHQGAGHPRIHQPAQQRRVMVEVDPRHRALPH